MLEPRRRLSFVTVVAIRLIFHVKVSFVKGVKLTHLRGRVAGAWSQIQARKNGAVRLRFEGGLI